MGKKRMHWDKNHYYQFLKDGRGQGDGDSYIPWIYVHDFASKGISTRVLGRTTGRIHHLLSRNEVYYFYLLDMDPEVTDIREQFPLRLSETIAIAERFHIRHPWKQDFYSVLTTDFLISRKDRLQARTIKMSKELDNPRTIEKFQIEAQYWKEHGVDWKIVTEKQINRDKSRNLQLLASGPLAGEMIPDPVLLAQVRDALIREIQDDCLPFPEILTVIEEGFCLAPGSTLAVFKDAVLSGTISLNLDRRINMKNPLEV